MENPFAFPSKDCYISIFLQDEITAFRSNSEARRSETPLKNAFEAGNQVNAGVLSQ